MALKRKTYVGCKIVQAEKMSLDLFNSRYNRCIYKPVRKNPQGYHVISEDGHDSWSPKDAFEKAYREIGKGEETLILTINT